MRRLLWIPLLLLVACGDDDPVRSGRTPTPARNPDQLVEHFKQAFTDLDFDLYDRLRHTDFLFEFSTADIALSGSPNGIWGRSQDSDAVLNILDGVPGKDTPAVQSIDLKLYPQSSSWETATEPGLEGTLRRSYAVEATFILTNADRFIVTGLQDFYAIEVERSVQLYYWRDQGLDASKGSTDSRSFGSIKSRY